ncbi:rhomboid-domain-containing protein [Marasmius fiardii PR-910]|nr:rhomboid-domain-containing protein [Marasmius fiardii PR-910]
MSCFLSGFGNSARVSLHRPTRLFQSPSQRFDSTSALFRNPRPSSIHAASLHIANLGRRPFSLFHVRPTSSSGFTRPAFHELRSNWVSRGTPQVGRTRPPASGRLGRNSSWGQGAGGGSGGGSGRPGLLSKFLNRIPQSFVFYGILAINGVVFLMWTGATRTQMYSHDSSDLRFMMNNFMCSWRNLYEGRVRWTLITNMFSHKDIGHILFNCFTFYFLGQPVIQLLGTARFLGLWFGSGLLCNVSSLYWNPKEANVHSHGSSGCINGIMAFLACTAPTMRFLIWGIVPVPAWILVSGLFAYDLYGTINRSGSGVDTAGHVGGTIGGVLYYLGIMLRVIR